MDTSTFFGEIAGLLAATNQTTSQIARLRLADSPDVVDFRKQGL